MSGILSLAPELIQAIGVELGPYNKELRRVCRQFDFVVAPQVLSHVVVDIHQHKLDTSIELLEALATHSTHATEHIRIFDIRCLVANHDVGDTQRRRPRSHATFVRGAWIAGGEDVAADAVGLAVTRIKRCLQAAIASLTKVHTVNWILFPQTSSWAQKSVIDGLTTLRGLRNLHIKLSNINASDLRLDHISGLRRISIRGSCISYQAHIIDRVAIAISNSPLLESIDIVSDGSGSMKYSFTIDDLLGSVAKHASLCMSYLKLDVSQALFDTVNPVNLRHLHSLTSLELTNTTNLKAPPTSRDKLEVWDFLRIGRINLETLKSPLVSTSLVQYLDSYIGVKKLDVVTSHLLDDRLSQSLAASFYERALDRQAPSLEYLAIRAPTVGGWSLKPDHILCLSKCTNLRELDVHVMTSDIVPQREQDVISMLIDTAATISIAMLSVSITPDTYLSKPVAQRGAADLDSNKSIIGKILAYRSHLPPDHLPEITFINLIYQPRQCKCAGGSQYIPLNLRTQSEK